jgi:hypothetical protein
MVLCIGIIQISKKYARYTFQTLHTCLECRFAIEGSRKFQSLTLFGWRKMLISLKHLSRQHLVFSWGGGVTLHYNYTPCTVQNITTPFLQTDKNI